MKRSLTRRIRWGIGITLLVLVLNAVISYRNIFKLIDNERSVRQSYQILAQLEKTLSTIKDAETGQRGYLLTGQVQYLEPYNAAIVQIAQQLQALREIAVTPAQQQQLESLGQATSSKLAELDQTIKLRRAGEFNAALQIVQTNRGKQLMDEIRQQIAVIEAQEQQQLQQRAQESQRSLNSTLLTFTLATGAGLIFLVLLARSFNQQQQQAELDLRTREQQFKATFNQAAVGMAHVAPNGSWLMVNQKLCDIVGYEHDELLKLTFQGITHPDDLETDLLYVQQMLAGQIQTYAMEKRYIRKNRSIVWIQLTVSLVRESNGQPKYFISIVEDISDRKAAEAALQRLNATLEQQVAARTAQLTELNQELETFTYSVSHDLRAPLRVMYGFAQALQEDYGDQFDDLARTYSDRISENAMHMSGLIDDLLNYSRLTQTQIRLQPTDLNRVVQTALQQLDADIQARQVVFHVADLPPVMAQRSILTQAVANLISNAIKFVQPPMQPIVRISAQVEENSVRLSVEDNGIGIAPEHQDRIFRVFERLHGIETFPGTGIGLAIVRRGLDRMGGRVEVESQLGHGSRFSIVLPLALDSHPDLLHD